MSRQSHRGSNPGSPANPTLAELGGGSFTPSSGRSTTTGPRSRRWCNGNLASPRPVLQLLAISWSRPPQGRFCLFTYHCCNRTRPTDAATPAATQTTQRVPYRLHTLESSLTGHCFSDSRSDDSQCSPIAAQPRSLHTCANDQNLLPTISTVLSA